MSFIRKLVAYGAEVFSENDLRIAHDRVIGKTKIKLTFVQKILFVGFWFLHKVPNVWRIAKNYYHGLRWRNAQTFTEKTLHHDTNHIYSLPEIQIDRNRPRTVNVLVPAFSIQTISAGFFGVFQLALFIARQGYHTRLVMFDNFDFSYEEFQEKLKDFSGLETLTDELEVEYIGERRKPLLVSPEDDAVATVWYSAYLANEIRKTCNKNHFLYLVQDYESGFYPYNSLHAFADNTYKMPFKAIFSTKFLQEFFVQRGMIQGAENRDYVYFNNACSSATLTQEEFMALKKTRIRRVVFYSRPMVDRNMFHLGAMALIQAYRKGVFARSGHNWEFYGIGIGNSEILLDQHARLKQLPRMTLKEYEKKMGEFDLCLTLMASPHPSLIPMDLAGSGALVVTNSFANKNADNLSALSKNIFCAHPDVDSVVAEIERAVSRIDDLEARYENSQIDYPKSWDKTWQQKHRDFLQAALQS